jgi:predicted DNA-binding transcriptional regulator AlpA
MAHQSNYDADDAYKVLNLKQWMALAGVSISTAKRILASGDGPPVLQLSARRIGIRLIDHRKWTERLAKKAG